jgi:hypothetical protein
MINSKELRIGNFIYNVKDQIYKVVASSFLGGTYLGFEPIPLTEEWLFNFGFKKVGQTIRLQVTNYLELCYMTFDNTLRLQTIKSGFTEDTKIKFVHELQNIHYWLTRKELELKTIEK